MIAVRLLNDAGVARERSFFRFPVTLGRDENCDVVLFDESCSRLHARIVLDEAGNLSIEDAGSRHGLTKDGAKTERVAITTKPTRVFLGNAQLELVALSTGTTQEIPVGVRRPAAPHVGRTLGWLAAALSILVASTMVDPAFWSPWKSDRQVSTAWLVIAGAVALPIAAFVLLAVLRIAGRRPSMADCFRGQAVAFALLTALEISGIVTYYVLSTSTFAVVETLLGVAAAVTGVVYVASIARSGPGRGFKLAWGLATLALILAGRAAGRLEAAKSGKPNADYRVLMPIAGHTGPAVGVDEYLGRVKTAFESTQ